MSYFKKLKYLFSPLKESMEEIVDEFLKQNKKIYCSKLVYKGSDTDAQQLIRWVNRKILEKREGKKTTPDSICMIQYNSGKSGRMDASGDCEKLTKFFKFLKGRNRLIFEVEYELSSFSKPRLTITYKKN